MKTRVLESGLCDITQNYSNSHKAIDLVREGSRLDYVVAHSDGKVVIFQDGISNMKGSVGNLSYGNFVKIDHENGYATLYAHMASGLNVRNGDYVKKGQRIGYMSDSGNAYGKHLHFEVWKDNERINPYLFLDSNLVVEDVFERNVGDIVNINGVYISSDSVNRLVPLVTTGRITKIVNGARNPYLLNNGSIGWVNDDVIIGDIKYLSNPSYNGKSLVDALNQINVDSSYTYRSKLANVNNISNYVGSAEQNTMMLNLLKSGKLIAI